MTSQILMSNPSSTLSRSQSSSDNAQTLCCPALSANPTGTMKCVYQADQQVKFLHLQAEVESLLLQLQALKEQRSTSLPETSLSQDTGSNSN
ncbi:MAG: hypothetical protein ACM37W_28260 [Actinomycetota bacterium]